MSYNILIVDDSQTMRKIIHKSVILSGFDIGNSWEADNGQVALDLVHRNPVDLILADLNMPVMGGLEMIQVLHEDKRYRTVPVILITTQGSEPRIEEAYRLGIKGFIQKPFYPEIIREILSRVMEVAHV